MTKYISDSATALWNNCLCTGYLKLVEVSGDNLEKIKLVWNFGLDILFFLSV